MSLFVLSAPASAQLGSAGSDLVYTPITPCRVLDTRTSQGGTGSIPAAGTKHFTIWGAASYAAQGGSPTNCGITAGANVAAVAMNFTVVTPAAGGFITAYPYGGAVPVAATVNFQAGDIARGDFTIAKVTQSGTSHLSIFSTSLLDVVGDVVGFYAKPVSVGSFQCIDSVATTSEIQANSLRGIASVACDAGYIITGGTCAASSYALKLSNSSIYSGTNQFGCSDENGTSTNHTVTTRGRCCRVSGR